MKRAVAAGVALLLAALVVRATVDAAQPSTSLSPPSARSAQPARSPQAPQSPLNASPAAAYFLRSFDDPRQRQEAHPEILDAPVLPGSVMKAVTLVAALESHVIEPDTARICRRVVTVDGHRYVCSHPDLKRPLTAAEALAHSCNDFFISLAPRLTRAAFNHVRGKLGLPLVGSDDDLAASFVGLAGPRISPRALLDLFGRLTGIDKQRPVEISTDARSVLLNGLRGAVDYGTATALRGQQPRLLAKTGTAPMPQGSFLGLVVVLDMAATPSRGLAVVAPGAAGADAATIAADVLAGRLPRNIRSTSRGSDATTRPAISPPPVAPTVPTAPMPVLPAPLASAANDPDRRPLSVRVSVNGRVTALDLEDYVARVLAGEGQPRAADGAQQALAVTARSFAVANLGRHRREGYDLCDTTHCQVMRAPTDTTRRASAATAGLILTHRSQPASVFYSALCGGHSELASEVWPGAVDYQSQPHEDEACRGEPGWTSELRADQLERALRTAGLRGSRLRDLRVLQRNASARVSRLRVDGFTPAEISGHDLRMAVGRVAGWQHLKSTAFEVRRTANGYRFSGTGFGHGVGLCVIGAGHRAARGNNAAEILRFYFPTLAVQPYTAVATTLAGVGKAPTAAATSISTPRPDAKPAPPDAAGSPPLGDVLLALPGANEGDRPQLLQMIRGARDEIAKRAGRPVPDALRITVHPSVEAFARATGQPWWVSGATDGSRIDLLPLDILRQRGPLERTLRHEVAHAVLDDQLRGRPLWVREGAAFYFANPLDIASAIDRAICPRDEEFLKPLSAGAHRAAYARAEACFRRAVAGGKRWDEVR